MYCTYQGSVCIVRSACSLGLQSESDCFVSSKQETSYSRALDLTSSLRFLVPTVSQRRYIHAQRRPTFLQILCVVESNGHCNIAVFCKRCKCSGVMHICRIRAHVMRIGASGSISYDVGHILGSIAIHFSAFVANFWIIFQDRSLTASTHRAEIRRGTFSVALSGGPPQVQQSRVPPFQVRYRYSGAVCRLFGKPL